MDENWRQRKLKQELRRIYYNPSHPASFSSIEKLFKATRKFIPALKRSEVQQWLKSQKTYTLHKNKRIKFKRNPMISRHVDQWWQADLAEITDISRFNDGYKYLLVIIDVLSKYAWVLPIKTKNPRSIIGSFKRVFRDSKRKPKFLYTDAGTEFNNALFNNFLIENNIKLIIARNTETKAAVAERFIRTLREKIAKYITFRNQRIIKVLPKIVNAYNNTVHSRTKYKPVNVTKNNEKVIFKNLFRNNIEVKPPKINIGDKVRIQRLKLPFEKGYTPKWTEELFVIEKNLKTLPFQRYTLKDSKGEKIKGSFYPLELQNVK